MVAVVYGVSGLVFYCSSSLSILGVAIGNDILFLVTQYTRPSYIVERPISNLTNCSYIQCFFCYDTVDRW